MPHDPVRIAETRSWLDKAQNDVRAAGVDMQARPPLIEDALFHCQQAVEKAMKAFLTWHDRPFRKTHSLAELAAVCEEIDASLKDALSETAGLSEYATIYRYPGEAEPPTRKEGQSARRLAKEVIAELLSRLPSEVTA